MGSVTGLPSAVASEALFSVLRCMDSSSLLEAVAMLHTSQTSPSEHAPTLCATACLPASPHAPVMQEWDGGSRGKVYTKGKRGKGFI